MNPKKKISEKEKQEFIDSMNDDSTLAYNNIPSPNTSNHTPLANNTELTDSFYGMTPHNIWHKGEDEIHFARSGLAPKTLKKLKQGKFMLSASLDLHGKTVPEAAALVEQFIAYQQNTTATCLLIIHGKGKQSTNGQAILKSHVAYWLRTDTRVLAFYSAQPRDGGNGALYVLIKKNR